MQRTTTALRELLSGSGFINMPSAYDAIGGRLIASLGFPAVYIRRLRHRRVALHVGAAADDG